MYFIYIRKEEKTQKEHITGGVEPRTEVWNSGGSDGWRPRFAFANGQINTNREQDRVSRGVGKRRIGNSRKDNPFALIYIVFLCYVADPVRSRLFVQPEPRERGWIQKENADAMSAKAHMQNAREKKCGTDGILTH